MSLPIHLPAHPVSAPSPTPTPRCVLVLEDDRTTQVQLSGGLRAAGYQVKTAARLSDARELLQSGGVDLLIADGLLPDGSGFEFVRELRSSGVRIPILFLSAFFKDFRTFRSLKNELSVDGVLNKPVAIPDLVGRVAEALVHA